MTENRIGCLTIKNAAVTGSALTLADAGMELVRGGAGALIVWDASDEDAGHERSLAAIQDLCAFVDIPVIGTGRIRRMEDVKKILYAGCLRAAIAQQTLTELPELVEEVTGKFGAERLAVLMTSEDPAAVSYARILLDPTAVLSMEKPVILSVRTDEGIVREPLQAAIAWEDLKKGSDGLIPVVVQDDRTNEVLMVAYMNEEAYASTLATGRMTYYSRSRREQWIKGETSGHYQYVRSLTADCDKDTILARVRQIGAACHTGSRSCFFNEIASRASSGKNPQQVLEEVYRVIADRKVHPKEGSYTNYLFDKGIDKILKKCGEEATEIVIAAKNPEDKEIVYEISDFLYHVMVLMVEKGVTWEEITDELSRR